MVKAVLLLLTLAILPPVQLMVTLSPVARLTGGFTCPAAPTKVTVRATIAKTRAQLLAMTPARTFLLLIKTTP
jgi:hypothetical protein